MTKRKPRQHTDDKKLARAAREPLVLPEAFQNHQPFQSTKTHTCFIVASVETVVS